MRVRLANGDAVDLGDTETAPTIGIIDYSRRVTDDFGVTTVVKRGFSRTLSTRLQLPFDGVDALQRRLAGLRATSALWIADDRFRWLSVQGFYKDFSLDLAVPPVSYCTLSIEGLAGDDGAADPGGDPAPDAISSTLQLLRPTPVTDAVLLLSNVAEDPQPEWSAATSYALGARVIRTMTHRVYESAIGANVGRDPVAGDGSWTDIGPTNRWAMFDQALGTATTGAGSVQVLLEPGTVNALSLLDVVGASVRVHAGAYDQTQAVGGGAVTFLDLPTDQGPVSVAVTGDGTVSVGTLLIGNIAGLGLTEASPTAAITDYSRKVVDDFGEVTIVQRAWAKRMTAKALIRTDAVDLVADRISAVRALPSLWIGQAGMDSLTIYGFFKDFSIEVGEGVSKLSLSIEGFSDAAKVEPLKVAWPDITDPTGTKPEDGATNGAPGNSPVGGVQQPDGTIIGSKPAKQVIDDLDRVNKDLNITIDQVDILTPTLFDLAKLAGTINAYMQARTTLDGKPIGTVVVDVRTVTESAVEELHLIGAKNGGGTAFLLNMETVQVADGVSLSQQFDQTEANASEAIKALSTSVSKAMASAAEATATQIETVQTNFATDIDAATETTMAAVTTADEALAKRITTGETTFGDFKTDFETYQEGVATSLGATSKAIDTVKAEIEGEGGISAQVSFLRSAVVTPGGNAQAKAVLSLKANGRVGGLIATNDGEILTLDLDFDVTRIFKPDGTLLFLAGPAGEVYMPAVRVDTLVAGAINFEFTGDRQLLDPAGWVQELPGGFIMMGGQYRASLTTETTLSIIYPKPFPLQTLAYGANGYNSNGNNRKDLFPQNTGAPSPSGASFYMQAPNDNAIALDGFDWWAWGR